MRIYNLAGLPEKPFYEALAFGARGIRDTGVVVRARARSKRRADSGPGMSGRCFAWPGGYDGHAIGRINGDPIYADVPRGTRALITLKLPREWGSIEWPRAFENVYELKGIDRRWPDGFPFEGPDDCVVYLAAHEFRHVWQAQREHDAAKRGKTVSGKGELDAETHALRQLNKYRLATNREPIAEAKQPNPFTVNA